MKLETLENSKHAHSKNNYSSIEMLKSNSVSKMHIRNKVEHRVSVLDRFVMTFIVYCLDSVPI